MMLGARTAAWAKSGGWVNPYVTDGLIAMWDGEWNAGPGVHDENATAWKDLTGNGYDFTTLPGFPAGSENQRMYWGDNYLWFPQVSSQYLMAKTSLSLAHTVGCIQTVKSSSRFIVQAGGGEYRGIGNYVEWLCSALMNSNKLYKTSESASTTLNYINGVQDTELYKEGILFTGQTTLYSYDVRINKNTNEQSLITVGGYGNSNCYCIRIYSRALTAAEVAANYAIDKARFNLP